MFIIYDLISLIFVIFFLPFYLLKGKFHKGFSRRFGILPKSLNLDRPIWVHAVSVGEAIAVRGLVEGLRKNYPGKKIVFSTVTATGNKIAQEIIRQGDLLTYLPLDFSFIIKSVVERINPSVFIVAETEIWPNLFTCLHKKNIPIITINGRISDKSFKKYRAIKYLLKPILNKITLICAQTKNDAKRFAELGARKEKIMVSGNLKFDAINSLSHGKKDVEIKLKLGLKEDDKLFVCGSTHPQEEEQIIGVYKNLLHDFPNLKLLIAPRHPNRAEEVGKLVSKSGLRSVLFSKEVFPECSCVAKPVFILDIIGRLLEFYALADIVFVGGSLVKKGGHNILEPAIFGKPIIFGAHMFNFRDIKDLFLDNKAAVLVNDPQELNVIVKKLLKDNAFANELGIKAKSLVLENQGATARTLELIKNEL
ncbi:MAG: 3-deoxy-D-manno-octulosonic acid transferase [Candidatus Omnitrophica bacterium]|nr:3-deoxy-D-manno-octulosonic acid transferase [Candidatus Omnitrophota bacterium]